MADYKEKIRKLLALAESPNENEAKAALLKARKLMAEHKISERDFDSNEPKNVVKKLTDITCSKRRESWIIPLSTVIGNNYCCKAYRNHRHGYQTQTIGFIGFEDDVTLCIEIFKYAVDCVRSKQKSIKKEYSAFGSDYAKSRCDSFGYGFVRGLSDAFDKQTEENERQWGLVLVTPPEVQAAADRVGKPQAFISRAQNNISGREFLEGYKAGQEFMPHRRLKEA